MGDPLKTAVRLLTELPPLAHFLASIPDVDVPSQAGGHSSGLELPAGCADFWQVAADEELKELRSESSQEEAEVRKARLRRFLNRAHHAKKGQPPPRGCCSNGLLSSGKWAMQDLPPGVTNPLPGLFLADVPQACENGLAPPASLSRRLGVEDVQCFGDFASDEQRGDFWNVYRLFAERLVLLFDQGRSVLAVGPPAVLTCLVYGVALRFWHLKAGDAQDYLKHLGRSVAQLPRAFKTRCEEERPKLQEQVSVLQALWQHARLLQENHHWPLSRAEPFMRATEALLARALGWEPRRHDSLTVGAACLAILRSVRAELGSLPDKSYDSMWLNLACVRWRIRGKTGLEDGLSLKVAEAAGEAEKTSPAKLSEELALALQDAERSPQLMVLVIDGERPVAIPDSIELGSSVSYGVFALATNSSFITRAAGSSLQAIQGASLQGGHLILQPPFTVVLMQGPPGARSSWTPWPRVISACAAKSCKVVVDPRQTFQLRLATMAQYDVAKRSRDTSAWEEVDAVGEILDMPSDARISLLQQKLATKLQIPVSWQLILAPSEQRWNVLLPNARIIDHAVSAGNRDGSLVLILSMQRDAGQWPLQRSPKLYEQPATTFLTFPWMPVLCVAWVDQQMVLLDSLLLDARCSLASYAGRVARRIEEELGPRAHSTAFAVYEFSAGSRESWRPLKIGAPIATELRQPNRQPQQGGSSHVMPQLLWEALPLAPSMTGRAHFAAQDAACLPDPRSTKKLFPLERLAARKADQQEAGLALLCQQLPARDLAIEAPLTDCLSFGSDAEDYSALLILEERLLVAWVEDSVEATNEVAAEARRRIDAMTARLAVLAPHEPPPGLKEWPSEPIVQWSCRIWEKICRGASSFQVWAPPGPDATEDEVMRNLLWAEVSTLQEIVLSLEAIRFSCQGRATLGNPTRERITQVSHIGATVSDVLQAERCYYFALLNGTELDELFAHEVEDLPSECDTDIGCLHAFIQTTNAELNSVWQQQREQILSKCQAQLWRIVRLRELSLSALFLLVKQTQATKAIDEGFLGWLQQVQLGCRTIIQKSKILCEAASAVAGLPGGGEDAIAEAAEELATQLSTSSEALEKLGDPACSDGPSKEIEIQWLKSDEICKDATCKAEIELHGMNGKCEEINMSEKSSAEEQLVHCDTHTLFGNLALLALERQLEASVTPPSSRLATAMQGVRLGLHKLTLQTMLVRARYDLPMDDAATTFTTESQRRGRKLQLLGRNPKRSQAFCAPGAPPSEETLAAGEAAEAEAEEQAKAFLKSEEAADAKKAKKKKQRQKKSAGCGVDAIQAPDTSVPSASAPDASVLDASALDASAPDAAILDASAHSSLEVQACKDPSAVDEIGGEEKTIISFGDDLRPTVVSSRPTSEPEEEAAPEAAFEETVTETVTEEHTPDRKPKLGDSWVTPMRGSPETADYLSFDEEDALPDTGFRLIESKRKIKVAQPDVKETAAATVAPHQHNKRSDEVSPQAKRNNKQSGSKRRPDKSDLREAPANTQEHTQEKLLLEKGTCELLAERRKIRLIEIERVSHAQCTLDKVGQVLRLSGTATEVSAALRMVQELTVQWMKVTDAVWRVLLCGRSGGDNHLSRLQKECGCNVAVERSRPWVKIAGTVQPVERAQAWLKQLHDQCKTAKVRLPSHVKWAPALARKAEGSGIGVKVDLRRENGAFIAHVDGLAVEVDRAVEVLNSEIHQSSMPSDHETHWIEVSASVWRLLLQDCCHVNRLQDECECCVTVDQSASWVVVNGTDHQAEKVQSLLWQFFGGPSDVPVKDRSNAQYQRANCDNAANAHRADNNWGWMSQSCWTSQGPESLAHEDRLEIPAIESGIQTPSDFGESTPRLSLEPAASPMPTSSASTTPTTRNWPPSSPSIENRSVTPTYEYSSNSGASRDATPIYPFSNGQGKSSYSAPTMNYQEAPLVSSPSTIREECQGEARGSRPRRPLVNRKCQETGHAVQEMRSGDAHRASDVTGPSAGHQRKQQTKEDDFNKPTEPVEQRKPRNRGGRRHQAGISRTVQDIQNTSDISKTIQAIQSASSVSRTVEDIMHMSNSRQPQQPLQRESHWVEDIMHVSSSRQPQQPVQRESYSKGGNNGDTMGTSSLAASLAKQFPSARISIGPPELQEQRVVAREPAASKPPAAGGDQMESKMRRLQQLLDDSRSAQQ